MSSQKRVFCATFVEKTTTYVAEHNDTGKFGEEKAVEFLTKNGYEIVAKNHKYQHAEIDIIAKKEKLLLFVEVKTRTNLSFGNPEEFVNYTKAKLIMKAAEHYIFAKDWQFDIRFDIIAVTIKGSSVAIKHIEDAFY